MPTMTPNEVANRSGMSRRTVMRAITKGLLIAKRTNNGWSIEEQDFNEWAPAHALPTDAVAYQENPMPTLQVAILEERIRGLETVLNEMRSDRDAWRAMAQRPWWKRLVS